ncbi:hypothetical protein GOB25_07800 [Sinorhizobium meliloti]|nr:hypothetical protein [Sinorhizobium meliloti]
MTDRPILFSGPMIRALLDDRKTQTRRIIKPQPFASGYYDGEIELNVIPANYQYPKAFRFNANAVGGGAILEEIFEPRINAGDRLWVKENAAVRHESWHHVDGDAHQVCYRADEDEHGRWLGLASCGNGIRRGKAPSVFPRKSHNLDGSLRWQPSIHMPRWASRLTLIVTDVRVERLQDISEADAKAEGLQTYLDGDADDNGRARIYEYFRGSDDLEWERDPVDAYLSLWDAINGDGAAQANPWVVAYTFTVIKQNIDQIDKVAA